MKKTLFVHIGMGKTGTTALQNFFWTNRKQLMKYGICYPEIGIVAGAHHQFSPYRPDYLKGWNFLDVETWGPELAKTPLQNILISSELIAWTSEEIVANFCNKLKELFEVKIIIYLRRQDDMIMATYNQQIRAGTQTIPICEILDHEIIKFDYEKKIRPWERAVGTSNIIVRPYEKRQLFEGDLIKDFLHHVFGIKFSDRFVVEKKNMNPRLSPSAMEFKRLINHFNFDLDESDLFNQVLIKYSYEEDENLEGTFSSSEYLSPQIRLEIIEKCKESNENIARKYLGRPDGRLFLNPLPDLNEKWEPIRELPESKILEIADYIKKHNLNLLERLRVAISENIQTGDPNKGKVVNKLISLISNSKAQENKVRSFNKNELNSIEDLNWLNDHTFEIDNIKFFIDVTPGPVRRESEKNFFTIVKTKDYLNEYLSLPKEDYNHILELGIFQGGSLVFFDKIFKPKKIVSVDIKETEVHALEYYIKEHANHIKTYYKSSQGDPVLLKRIVEKDLDNQLDLVVDDASHLYELTKTSFSCLFPLLRNGGLYIIEDWAWSHEENAQHPNHPWFDNFALTNLIFEIIVELGAMNDIEEIQITRRMVKIKKAKDAKNNVLFKGNALRNRQLSLI